LDQGYDLVVLSSRTHHGIPRIQGIAREKGREVFIVEAEEDVDKIRLTRFEPVGVIVQTTFWIETYKKIMARILERFANVRVRNTACIDSLQRLPEVEQLAKRVEVLIVFRLDRRDDRSHARSRPRVQFQRPQDREGR